MMNAPMRFNSRGKRSGQSPQQTHPCGAPVRVRSRMDIAKSWSTSAHLGTNILPVSGPRRLREGSFFDAKRSRRSCKTHSSGS